ncbi:MAG: hypothetical protein LBR69_06270 [Endomicrobium sp.]|nr:hypothetical protein [Endomicrobium sp.]
MFLVINKSKFGAKNIQFSQSFNRNLFFLSFDGLERELKLEFTFYPFERIDLKKKYGNFFGFGKEIGITGLK